MKFPPLRQKGFTLIELMVVIVIISIIASLIVLNIDGVDQRKAMQSRELLILDLKNQTGKLHSATFSPNGRQIMAISKVEFSISTYFSSRDKYALYLI